MGPSGRGFAGIFLALLCACDLEDRSGRSVRVDGCRDGACDVYPACGDDEGCRDGERCEAGTCVFVPPCPCDDGFGCDDSGGCRATCSSHGDCYDAGAYCAANELCCEVDPAADWARCDRAERAPSRDPGGPLIFDLGQADTNPGPPHCVKDPRCTNDGNVCTFELAYFDPDGDVPTTPSEAYLHLAWIGVDGEPRELFDAPLATDTHFWFRVCFDAALETVGGAVQLTDRAGRHSNTQCFEGSAP